MSPSEANLAQCSHLAFWTGRDVDKMDTDLSIHKAKFVLAKLKKKNVSVIKPSEFFQMCRRKFFKKTEEIFPTLELLEGHGYIRLEEPERQSVGRPADVKIIVNPAA